MSCRGLIIATGPWSLACQPVTVACDRAESTIQIPRVCFTIDMLVTAGITKILLGTTPQNLESFRSILLGFKDSGVEISYLLLRDEGVCEALAGGHEFAAQSNFAVAPAGFYCEGTTGDPSRLRTVLAHSRGVTAFRMLGCLSSEGQTIPELLVVDARTRTRLQTMDTRAVTDFRELRRFCALHFRYSEVDLRDSHRFVSLAQCQAIDKAFPDSEVLARLASAGY